jgi:hypothetical protein
MGFGSTRTWRSPPGRGRSSHMSLNVHPSAWPNPSVRRARQSNPALLHGGDVAYCTINGREFARVVRENAAIGTIEYLGYDGQTEINIRLMYDPRDPKSRDLLEAAARTIR